MKIAVVSNYLNHHQIPLANAFSGADYTFIQTGKMSEERKKLGYGMDETPAYLLDFAEQPDKARQIILDADLVIAGSAPEELLKPRIKAGKLIFRYAERPLKQGLEMHKYLPRLLRWHQKNPGGKPIYMLCASGYTAGDYRKFGLFRGRSYRWGYFPQTHRYDDPAAMMEKKDPTHILWCGRFLDWKHPDDALAVAKRLNEEGCDFRMTFVGMGEMGEEMARFIEENGLSHRVTLAGSMKPEQVREMMENAGIYLFTSDRQEGWGAVLNESMNAGCAVVASHLAGAAPFLVNPGVNGLVYPSTDVDGLYENVKKLLENPDLQKKLGLSAYETIANEWNAEVAATRITALAEAILAGDKSPDLYESGPCSRAKIVKESWYKR